MHFSEAVVAAAGDVSQIERCDVAGTAQAGGGAHHVSEHVGIGFDKAEIAERETGADQAFFEPGAVGAAQAAVVLGKC